MTGRTAIGAPAPEPEPEHPVVTYANFRGHYRRRLADVATVLTSTVATPARVVRRALGGPEHRDGDRP